MKQTKLPRVKLYLHRKALKTKTASKKRNKIRCLKTWDKTSMNAAVKKKKIATEIPTITMITKVQTELPRA